jgi:hypothetical protein
MSFFTDVIEKDPGFKSLKRINALALLEPVTRAAVQKIIEDSKVLGLDMMVFETFRSQARQQQLFAQGATKLRTVGVHNDGLACDIVKVVGGEPSWKGDFSFLGLLARKHGLIWGGDWGTPGQHHTFIDSVHVQRCSIARQPDLFRGEWYPDDAYNPFDD